MSFPVVDVQRPVDLLYATNGNLAASELEAIGPRGQLHHCAARAWRALAAAALHDDIPLTYSYGGTYRSFDDQVALFRSRYSTIPQAGQRTKQWRSTTYWQLPHTAMAAVPGTSNHGWGLAIDTALDNDWTDGIGPDDASYIGPHLPWLLANAPAFGFSWETQSEAWHIRLVTGSTPTAAVLVYESSDHRPAPPAPPVSEDDMPIRILRSMTDPPEFNAEFVALTDGAGHSIEVQWSGRGDDPKVAARLQHLRDAGVKDQHILLAGLRDNVLHPRYQPADINDDLHTWTADDFA